MPVQTREKRKRQQELEQKQKEQGEEQPKQQEEDSDKSEERASKKRRGGRKKEAEASTGQSKPAEEAEKPADTEKAAEKNVEEQIQKLASEQVVAGVSDEKLHTRVIEKGQIYFFYRQKELASEVETLDDVQRLYILLNPTSVLPASEISGGESKSDESDQPILNRLLIIGKKQLPDIDAKTKFWGMIYKTSANLEELKGLMEARIPNEQNTTSNQSNKKNEPAVLVGQGVYALVEHGAKHVHLAYALELPEVPGEAQDLFNIRQEDSFIIQVKNPMISTQPLPPSQEKQQKEEKEKEYSKEELESFHKNRWGAPKPLSLLNHPSTEVLIIGASHDIARELGKPGEMLENEARQMSKQILKIANLTLPQKILSTPAESTQEEKGKEQNQEADQQESTQRKGADLSLHEKHKHQESGEATTEQKQQSTSA